MFQTLHRLASGVARPARACAALGVLALGLGAGAAHAGGVHWSIGINLPSIGTVISNAPVYPAYVPAPVYVPPPVVYRPAPVVVSPGYYYGPPPVVVDRRWGPPRGEWHPHHHRGYRDDRWGRDERWDRGPRDRGGRWRD
ncbi:hypothetical protein [Piscinibacter sakaiensis]|uniref:Putative signal peptide protein n=1 Tax=Piscinibacter sakaiensis TaxID=1547922 RepID=A0A0K8P2Q4_PISS1|nr:hypothetical protein [Piscinibacter sakaiensis]GAP36814.1 putative signal peptide protein [Piscinibacter sakaiensis]